MTVLPSNPRIFQALTIAKALEIYAKTGIQANTLYTPANMRRMAQSLTGLIFKPRDYLGMAQALRNQATIIQLNDESNNAQG